MKLLTLFTIGYTCPNHLVLEVCVSLVSTGTNLADVGGEGTIGLVTVDIEGRRVIEVEVVVEHKIRADRRIVPLWGKVKRSTLFSWMSKYGI